MFWLTGYRFKLMDEATGEGEGGTGGAPPGHTPGDTPAGGGGEDTLQGGEGNDTPPAGSDEAMAEAMTALLRPEEPKTTTTPAAGTTGAPAAAATTTPAIDPAKAAEDAKAALLAKKPEDFKPLSAAEEAVLKPVARQRFKELADYGNAQYQKAQEVTAQFAKAQQSYDALMGAFESHAVEPNDLPRLLMLNKALKTNPKVALEILNHQRAQLMRTMGIEGEGVDLLADHPDLKEKVDNSDMTREAALEVVRARMATKAINDRSTQQQTQQQRQQQAQQVRDQAVHSIEQWCTKMSKDDPVYRTKEAQVVKQIASIMQRYPADKWLDTIQLLYDSIPATSARESALPSRENTPLRPTGGGPGAKAPGSMEEAITAGLRKTG